MPQLRRSMALWNPSVRPVTGTPSTVLLWRADSGTTGAAGIEVCACAVAALAGVVVRGRRTASVFSRGAEERTGSRLGSTASFRPRRRVALK